MLLSLDCARTGPKRFLAQRQWQNVRHCFVSSLYKLAKDNARRSILRKPWSQSLQRAYLCHRQSTTRACDVSTTQALLAHFRIKLFLAAPESFLPSALTALGKHVSRFHFLRKLLSAAPASGLPFLLIALLAHVSSVNAGPIAKAVIMAAKRIRFMACSPTGSWSRAFNESRLQTCPQMDYAQARRLQRRKSRPRRCEHHTDRAAPTRRRIRRRWQGQRLLHWPRGARHGPTDSARNVLAWQHEDR